jgi:flagellar assembly factor FliW
VTCGEERPTVRVESNRFGSFDVPQEKILVFPQGLIGFPDGRHYVILEHRPGSPFRWMLSIENPDLAFAVADPSDLVGGYAPSLDLAARLLSAEPSDVALFVLVTIPPDPTLMTVNLLAPVVVDVRTRTALQIVLDDERFSPSHFVVPQMESIGP